MPERGLHAELKEWLRRPGDLVEGTVWGYRVRLVYPVPEKRWVIREVEGRKQRRVSPRVRRVEEVFNELVYCPTLPLDQNFSLEVLLVHSEEAQAVRWRGRKRTRYTVTERRLVKVVSSTVFEKPDDYLKLIPDMHGAFTARQLSNATGLRITLARRIVYCLAKMGVLEEVGSVARAKLYKVKA